MTKKREEKVLTDLNVALRKATEEPLRDFHENLRDTLDPLMYDTDSHMYKISRFFDRLAYKFELISNRYKK